MVLHFDECERSRFARQSPVGSPMTHVNFADLRPNPFQAHPLGPWESRMRPVALAAIVDALRRYRAGEISRDALREDKNRHGIKYWLWYMHHPDNNYWKNIGRPYWSYDAYLTWRRCYYGLAANERVAKNGMP